MCTCWPPSLLSPSEQEMRITLLTLPKDPASAVTSCSVASGGTAVRYTRRSANGESGVAAGTTFFFFLAGGGLADWKMSGLVQSQANKLMMRRHTRIANVIHFDLELNKLSL